MSEIEEVLRGYSSRDEYVARDLLLINLLLEKGLITAEDINRIYTPENLSKYIGVVQQEYKKAVLNEIKEREHDSF